jgi:hypothetical protein
VVGATCPGYGLRGLHAMSSASIMMMLLSGIPSRFTVLPITRTPRVCISHAVSPYPPTPGASAHIAQQRPGRRPNPYYSNSLRGTCGFPDAHGAGVGTHRYSVSVLAEWR